MADNIVGPLVHAVFQHQKAQSACCGEKLQLPADPAAEHEFECRSCGQPTERVLGEPAEHHAYSDGHPALAVQQDGA